MDETRSTFYNQQFDALMRAIYTAVSALDDQDSERARKVLADVWDSSVLLSHQFFLSDAGQ